MNFWIFITTDQKDKNRPYTAREIYEQRMEDSFWGLAKRTPNRKNLEIGDKVIFYLGNPEKMFAGIATIASENYKLSPDERELNSHQTSIFDTEYGVNLKDIEIWESPRYVPDLVLRLDFIENKEYWGSYFQGGVRGIIETDFQVIVNPKKVVESKTVLDEDTQQFALEVHLEEFIHANWDKVNWQRNLHLYETKDSNGRQFPAGTWSIDFLAIDNDTNDFVVIELKRGHTSDAVVGQTLRYIGWVKENLADNGQNVKGIIVCREVDDALRYSVGQINDIDVLMYQVNFHLEPMQYKGGTTPR